MYKGFILFESLNNPIILNSLEKIYVQVEDNEGQKPRFWNDYKVRVPDDQIDQVTQKLSQEMKNGWYSHFWNEKEIVVILPNKVFKNPVKPEKMIEAVFRQLITEPNIAKIVIDGKKPRWYEQKLKKVLRDKGVAVKKLKTARSTSELGIQLADALAGLVRYSYDSPNEEIAVKLLQRLKKKEKILGIYLLEPAAEFFANK